MALGVTGRVGASADAGWSATCCSVINEPLEGFESLPDALIHARTPCGCT